VNLMMDNGLIAYDDIPKLLHIYGQGAWHGDVYIVGNREALEELRDTIDEALCDVPHSMEAFVNDGEGYELKVVLHEGGWDTKSWKRLAVPYFEKCAIEKREDTIVPWELNKGE